MKKLLGILLLLSVFSIYAANNNILCSIEYFYSDDGMLIGKAINGNRINYEYDLRGQLLSVKDTNGKVLESYTYDKVGNILSKTVNGKTTTYTYDKANQLISSTIDGKTTNYKYDAAGRMIQAGSKTYRYKYLDKVAEVRENGKVIAEFEYTVEGQVSTATYGDKTEEFMWDGLALIKRNDTSYLNEPYVTGGNPILADNDVMFNDMLGNTVAINGKSVDMTAFGETENTNAMFTGKPHVAELGYAFLFRNYDSSLGKWSTSDPLGYPDGWNNFAYCNNWATTAIDWLGGWTLVSDTAMPPTPSAVTSSTQWTYGENFSAYGIYSITTYSWVQIATNGGTNGEVLLQTANAKTTLTSTINQYSASLSQEIIVTANAKGGFPGIAEFSAGISNGVSETISTGYSLQSGTSTTESVLLGYSATADQNTYIEIIAYQLVATTTYYAKYVPPSEISEPIPFVQSLGAICAFNANLSYYGSRQKIYKE